MGIEKMNWTGYFDKVLNSNYRSSAMTPLLWLNGLITLPCIVLAIFSTDNMRWLAAGLSIIMVLYTLWKYDYLVKKDPRLVQSERLQILSQKLDIIAEKGGEIEFENVDLNLIEIPYRLEEGKNEKEEGQK